MNRLIKMDSVRPLNYIMSFIYWCPLTSRDSSVHPVLAALLRPRLSLLFLSGSETLAVWLLHSSSARATGSLQLLGKNSLCALICEQNGNVHLTNKLCTIACYICHKWVPPFACYLHTWRYRQWESSVKLMDVLMTAEDTVAWEEVRNILSWL